MAQTGAMSPDRVINGTYAELYDDGESRWLANAQGFEARWSIDRRDISLAGKRSVGYKAMGISMSGSFRLLKVDDTFLATVTAYLANRTTINITNLRVRFDDPDQFGNSEHLFKNVKIWEAALAYNVNELMEETVPFTFEDYEPIAQTVGVNLTS